jgi:hypothetical protein
LNASLSIQCDDRAIRQRLVSSGQDKLFVNDTHLVVGYDDYAEDPQDQLVTEERDQEEQKPCVADEGLDWVHFKLLEI